MTQMLMDYLSGVGINKLAKKYQISSWSVTKELKLNGIEIRKPSRKTVTDSILIKLSEKHHDAEIARIVGLSKVSISTRLRALGVQAKPTDITNRRFIIDLIDMIQLDKEIGAYWLGFLLADGNIAKKRTRLTCNLKYTDYRHLQALCCDLRTDKMPKKRYVTTNSKKFARASIAIDCKSLCHFYKSIGWDQFKSGDLSMLPSTLSIRHFLRGFWDGDGIVTTSRNNLRLGVCSQHDTIIEWITNELSCLNLGKPQKISIYNNCCYRFWGGYASIKIAKFLYTNQTRALIRKVDKIMRFNR